MTAAAVKGGDTQPGHPRVTVTVERPRRDSRARDLRISTLERTPEEQKAEWIKNIKSRLDELRRTGKPVLLKSIVKREFRWPYHAPESQRK